MAKIFLNEILDTVCTILYVTQKDLKSKKRDKEIVKARHLYCFIAKEKTKCSLSVIGEKISKDHSTVICAIKKIKFQVNVYDDIKTAYRQINKNLINAN